MDTDKEMRKQLRHLCLSVCICGFISGCFPKKPPTPEPYHGPTDAMYDVVKAINQNNDKLPTLWASIGSMQLSLVDEKGKRHDESLDGTLLYRSPRDVKLLGNAGPATKVLEIGSNRDDYWLVARKPGPDQAWWGRYRFLGDPRAKSVPVSPALIVEVLGISTINEDFNALPVPVMRFNNDSDCYMFIWNTKLPDRWAATREVWYDRRTKRPLKIFLFDANGRIVLSARLDKHKPVEVPNLPKEQWPLVATDYRLLFPDNGSSMHIVLDDVQLNHKQHGVTFPNDGVFHFSPESLDVSTVTPLDEDCGP
jgi:hypothetical protein